MIQKLPNIFSRIINLPAYLLVKFQSKFISELGKNTFLGLSTKIIGHKYIRIDDNVRIGDYSIITAWDLYNQINFNPQLTIKENTTIGDYAHITCINKVLLHQNIMIGKFVTITDNSHGDPSKYNEIELSQNPKDRNLYSKGPVVICENVWIGDKVSILPNVTIGRSSVVGANSVVTKNIPPFCVYAGNPAKLIKKLK